MSNATTLIAGVELGGTKCVCILGSGPDDIRAQVRIPTASPIETLREVRAVLSAWHAEGSGFHALGLACFGPLDLRPASSTFGHVTATTKRGWSGADVAGVLGHGLDVPVVINTDVAGAATAEWRWGAARGIDDFAYVTVGTGVGAALFVRGALAGAIHHSELGHIRVARLAGDSWPGACAFHGDCIEGLASGPAIAARTGLLAEDLGPDHPAWDGVVHALAQLIHTLALATAPRRVLLGGGVLQSRPELIARIRARVAASLNGYPRLEVFNAGLADYITSPGLGVLAGPLGALALAAGEGGDARAVNGAKMAASQSRTADT